MNMNLKVAILLKEASEVRDLSNALTSNVWHERGLPTVEIGSGLTDSGAVITDSLEVTAKALLQGVPVLYVGQFRIAGPLVLHRIRGNGKTTPTDYLRGLSALISQRDLACEGVRVLFTLLALA